MYFQIALTSEQVAAVMVEFGSASLEAADEKKDRRIRGKTEVRRQLYRAV